MVHSTVQKVESEGQHAWRGNSWLSSCEHGLPRRNTEPLLGMQKWSQKSQGSAGVGSSKGCEGGVRNGTSAVTGQLNKLWGCCAMGAGNLVTKYMEKAEKLLLPCFLLVKSALRTLSFMSLPEKSAGTQYYLQSEHLSHLHIHNTWDQKRYLQWCQDSFLM